MNTGGLPPVLAPFADALGPLAALGTALGGLCCSFLFLLVFGALVWRFVRSPAKSGMEPAEQAPVTLPKPAASSAQGASGVEAMQRMFSVDLGFTSQVQDDMARAFKEGRPAITHMVRTVEGKALHYRSSTQSAGNSIRVSVDWTLDCAPRVGIHVLEARLVEGLRGVAADRLLGRERVTRLAYEHPILSGDMAFDHRFRCFGSSPAAASVLALADVRQALLALPYVDVKSRDSGITLEDPFQEGLTSAMGGIMGMAHVLTADGIRRQREFQDKVAAALLALEGALR